MSTSDKVKIPAFNRANDSPSPRLRNISRRGSGLSLKISGLRTDKTNFSMMENHTAETSPLLLPKRAMTPTRRSAIPVLDKVFAKPKLSLSKISQIDTSPCSNISETTTPIFHKCRTPSHFLRGSLNRISTNVTLNEEQSIGTKGSLEFESPDMRRNIGDSEISDYFSYLNPDLSKIKSYSHSTRPDAIRVLPKVYTPSSNLRLPELINSKGQSSPSQSETFSLASLFPSRTGSEQYEDTFKFTEESITRSGNLELRKINKKLNYQFKWILTSNGWSPSCPQGRVGASLTAVKDKLYLYGGKYEKNMCEGLMVYHTIKKRWKTIQLQGESPKYGRVGQSALEVRGQIYYFGGEHQYEEGGKIHNRLKNDILVYLPSMKRFNNVVLKSNLSIDSRKNHAVCLYRQQLMVVYGGIDERGAYLNDVWAFDTGTLICENSLL